MPLLDCLIRYVALGVFLTLTTITAFAQQPMPTQALPNAEVPGYKLQAVDFVSSQNIIAPDGKTARSGESVWLSL
jgi:hypothetical protein